MSTVAPHRQDVLAQCFIFFSFLSGLGMTICVSCRQPYVHKHQICIGLCCEDYVYGDIDLDLVHFT